MRILFGILAVCFFVTQANAAEPLLSLRPHCATIKNDTGNSLFASIRTAYTPNAQGQDKRHEGSFRLEKDASTQVCSTGPFYPGYQVELVVKTMIPIFSCKTKLEGTITLTSSRDENDVYRVSANCAGPAAMTIVPDLPRPY